MGFEGSGFEERPEGESKEELKDSLEESEDVYGDEIEGELWEGSKESL